MESRRRLRHSHSTQLPSSQVVATTLLWCAGLKSTSRTASGSPSSPLRARETVSLRIAVDHWQSRLLRLSDAGEVRRGYEALDRRFSLHVGHADDSERAVLAAQCQVPAVAADRHALDHTQRLPPLRGLPVWTAAADSSVSHVTSAAVANAQVWWHDIHVTPESLK